MDILFWVYLVNAVLLIDHEIDSAYWKEWELFGMKGGVEGFLLLHLPMLGFILYGLVEVSRGTLFGLICSIILACGGIFALSIHSWFIKKGHEEFTLPVSKIILGSTAIVSAFQLVWTIRLLLQ